MSNPRDSYREQPDLECCATCKNRYQPVTSKGTLCAAHVSRDTENLVIKPHGICGCYERDET